MANSDSSDSDAYRSVSVTFTAPKRTIRDLAVLFPDARNPSEALRNAILEVRLNRARLNRDIDNDPFRQVDNQSERFDTNNNR